MTLLIDNMITNDIKHGENTGIEIVPSSDESTAILTFKNSGTSISSAKHGAIFGKFGRSKSTKTSGIGLGLYIARQTLQQHGGDITVESEKNTGTIFTITLPRSFSASSV